mmetsp:Transcript_60405/g.144002  ORF Transcript_60405/g.144002 Transcript_60405/m.144002 type:complete len:569 (-) Transcript_60405:125-1831(-)
MAYPAGVCEVAPTNGAGQPMDIVDGFGPSPVREAWTAHFEAFGNRDVKSLMQSFDETSQVRLYNNTDGIKSEHIGLFQIAEMYEAMFAELDDLTSFEAPVTDVDEDAGQVFMVWRCPSSGYLTATATFIFARNLKIWKQNIVVTKVPRCVTALSPALPAMSPFLQGMPGPVAPGMHSPAFPFQGPAPMSPGVPIMEPVVHPKAVPPFPPYPTGVGMPCSPSRAPDRRGRLSPRRPPGAVVGGMMQQPIVAPTRAGVQERSPSPPRAVGSRVRACSPTYQAASVPPAPHMMQGVQPTMPMNMASVTVPSTAPVPTTMIAPPASAQQQAQEGGDLFSFIDRNHDGLITRQEWQEAVVGATGGPPEETAATPSTFSVPPPPPACAVSQPASGPSTERSIVERATAERTSMLSTMTQAPNSLAVYVPPAPSSAPRTSSVRGSSVTTARASVISVTTAAGVNGSQPPAVVTGAASARASSLASPGSAGHLPTTTAVVPYPRRSAGSLQLPTEVQSSCQSCCVRAQPPMESRAAAVRHTVAFDEGMAAALAPARSASPPGVPRSRATHHRQTVA